MHIYFQKDIFQFRIYIKRIYISKYNEYIQVILSSEFSLVNIT
jgi:hypothetical protein